MSAVDYENDHRYDEDDRGYERDERLDDRNGGDSRARSASPDGRDRMDTRTATEHRSQDDESARNPGSNLFVTGIHPRLNEEDVIALFQKFGTVEKCNIMRDPHSGDSRGFGFVKMLNPEQADAAREGLQGQVHEGRTLSIEKARRARPRTPTPGKYHGPPKRDYRPPRGGRYDDRRGGYGRRDDYYGGGYRGSRYGNDRNDDRGSDYDRRYRDRSDYGRVDRYASGTHREDRYGRGEERRGYYGREERSGYAEPPPPASREAYTRGYDDRGDYRDSRY